MKKRRAYFQIFNTTNEEIALKIPTLKVREIEKVFEPSSIGSCDFQSDTHQSMGITKRIFSIIKDSKDADRFEQIRPLLHLDY